MSLLVKAGTVVTRENIMAEAHKLARQLKVCMTYKNALRYALEELYRYMKKHAKQVIIRETICGEQRNKVGNMMPVRNYKALAKALTTDGTCHARLLITLVHNGYVVCNMVDNPANWETFNF